MSDEQFLLAVFSAHRRLWEWHVKHNENDEAIDDQRRFVLIRDCLCGRYQSGLVNYCCGHVNSGIGWINQ